MEGCSSPPGECFPPQVRYSHLPAEWRIYEMGPGMGTWCLLISRFLHPGAKTVASGSPGLARPLATSSKSQTLNLDTDLGLIYPYSPL